MLRRAYDGLGCAQRAANNGSVTDRRTSPKHAWKAQISGSGRDAECAQKEPADCVL
jgi:hypothetical protein